MSPPIMFEVLSRLNNQIGHTIWFGLSGANPDRAGCGIWMSDDEVSYQQVATAVGVTKLGGLTAILASHADPDTADTLSVDLAEIAGILESFTCAQADLFGSLCDVDGELISY